MTRSALGARTVSRLLPGDYADRTLAGHLARHGNRPSCADPRRRDDLIAEVERAGLTGRGGAGFPTAVKLRALAAAWPVPMVIANGVEGEPASDKDKVLLAVAPHLVLDGAVGAAELTGAREVVMVVHHAVREIVDHAVAERRMAGTDPVPVRVLTAADTFIAGEASAVVHWVERGVAAPTGRPPRLGGSGSGWAAAASAVRPALVQNVETLAHLALILRHGAAWFRSVGSPGEPGSMLITMAGAVRRPGVYEIETGTPVGGLIELAGGAAAPPGAWRAADRRVLRHLGRGGRRAAAAVLVGRAGTGRRKPGGRGDRRAAAHRLRAGRNRPDHPLPGPVIGGPVRAVRLRAGRDRRPARAAGRGRRLRPDPGAPLAGAGPGGVPASGRDGAHGGQRAARLRRRS